MDNGEVFVEVRQRVAAYRYYCEMNGLPCPDDEVLDNAYRFLYKTFTNEFAEFCARKENMKVEDLMRNVTDTNNTNITEEKN